MKKQMCECSEMGDIWLISSLARGPMCLGQSGRGGKHHEMRWWNQQESDSTEPGRLYALLFRFNQEQLERMKRF